MNKRNRTEYLRVYGKKYRETHKQQIVDCIKRWYLNHPGYRKSRAEYDKKYDETHKEEKRERGRRNYQKNKQKYLEIKRQYWKTLHGKDTTKKSTLKYRKTLKYRLAHRKATYKRNRELDYIIINKQHANNPTYIGHHIDKTYVLYIPESLHKSIQHKQKDDVSMDKINKAAFEWYFKKRL